MTDGLVTLTIDGPHGHGFTVHAWSITRAQYDELMAGLTKTIGPPELESATDDAGAEAASELLTRIAVMDIRDAR